MQKSLGILKNIASVTQTRIRRTCLGNFHLLEPALMIKNLKFHQDSCQLVKVADNFMCLWCFQATRMPLEYVHRIAYTPHELSSPADQTRDRRYITV